MMAETSVRSACPAQVLHVAGLTKRFDHELAVTDVTFSLVPGEVLGIVGPNGAGKTTLLETIAGLLASDSGARSWRGKQWPPQCRRDALFYLPDGVRPYQDRCAADVVSFFGRVYNRSAADIAATIASVGLAPALGKRVHALSKGYNRR